MFNKIIAENSPNFERKMAIWVDEAQRTPIRVYPEVFFNAIISQLSKVKSSQGWWHTTVIPMVQEARAGRLQIQSQSGQLK